MSEQEFYSTSNSFEALEDTEIPEQSEQDLKDAELALDAMHDVIDPELGINVVDLGLVYGIWISHEDDGGKRVMVNMTLTTPACPLTDVLEEQIQFVISKSGVAEQAHVNWVWMPPWGPHLITEDGREQLRALGFAV